MGHGKAEYIYSMLISIIIGVMAFEILKNSILFIFYKEHYEFSIWLIIVCIITIFVKLGLYLYTIKVAEENKSILLKANAKDHRNDCVITLFNLVSCILNFYGVFVVDGIVGVIIAIWILMTAINLFRES